MKGSLVGLLRHRAATLGHRQAFCFLPGHGAATTAMTYRELDEWAMLIGGELQTMVPSGSRALLLYPPGLDFVAAFFGCLYAGIVAVPVAPPGRSRFAWSAEQIFRAAKASLVLSTAQHRQEAARSYAPRAFLERVWIATDTISKDRRHAWSDPQVDSRHTAFLQYTSGSTSAPKGVMLSHDHLLHNAALIRQAFGNTPASSAVFWLPLYHDMGLIGGVIQPIYCGGSCTLLAPAAFLQRPVLWLETISRMQATISGGPDFAFDLCTHKIRPEDCDSLDLSSWDVAFVGAERVRASTLERFAEKFARYGFRSDSFFPCYGLAEATLMASGGPRRTPPTVIHVHADALSRHQVQEIPSPDLRSRSLVGCGENLLGQKLAIVDPKTCRLCADGHVGEIWIQGPSVAAGYYDQPEATAAAFGGYLATTGQGPFLRTGDFGFLRKGQLFVTGRLKDLIIVRGQNFYPEDIEHSVERACDELRAGHCAAFSIERGDCERLAIVQEIEPRCRNLDADRALCAIRRVVAAQHEVEVYAIALVKAGTIPKTSSGKTRRTECRERYLRGEMQIIAEWRADQEHKENAMEQAITSRSPRTVTVSEVEAWMTERIAMRMRLAPAQIQVTSPFLEFGMRSLDAVEIAADLERWLRRPLAPTATYNYPTISALARWLAGSPTDAPSTADGPAALWTLEKLDSDRIRNEVREMTEDEMKAFICKESTNIEREMAERERARGYQLRHRPPYRATHAEE
ncbi:MAG: AMP-binding protein [Thermoguttaceae bacterium]